MQNSKRFSSFHRFSLLKNSRIRIHDLHPSVNRQFHQNPPIFRFSSDRIAFQHGGKSKTRCPFCRLFSVLRRRAAMPYREKTGSVWRDTGWVMVKIPASISYAKPHKRACPRYTPGTGPLSTHAGRITKRIAPAQVPVVYALRTTFTACLHASISTPAAPLEKVDSCAS